MWELQKSLEYEQSLSDWRIAVDTFSVAFVQTQLW